MAFSIQTKYAASSLKQGDVVAIRQEGFKYFEGDCLKEWLNAGRRLETWRYPFVINYITDVGMDGTEQEVTDLLKAYNYVIDEKGDLTPDINAEFQRKKYLSIPQDYNNPHRINLRSTGETQITWSVFKQYIRDRI
jgi:hypothetical protein